MKLVYIITISMLFFVSCKKFLNVEAPKTRLTTITVFSDDASANSALTAIYSDMHLSGLPYIISNLSGLSADELNSYSTSQDLLTFQFNNLNASNSNVRSIWSFLYNYIYQANLAIEQISGSSLLSENVKRQLIGEALFVRSFCHFYLTNLYGDIPIITSTNYSSNNVSHRQSSALVYEQIIADLKSSIESLDENYVGGDGISVSGDRVRPNRWVATALLARVYLYTGDFDNSRMLASQLIQNVQNFSLEEDLNNVFKKESHEAIWQIQSVIPGYNSSEGKSFILVGPPSTGDDNSSVVSPSLINVFEEGDLRKANWIDSLISNNTGYVFPSKYKILNSSDVYENSVVFRLAEQYLIRAESNLNLGNLNEAIDDINILRQRAGLSDLPDSLSKEEVTDRLINERQCELFTEWGHRWLDLKRLDKANEILSTLKGSYWTGTDQLYPIPQSERNADPNLTQNPSY